MIHIQQAVIVEGKYDKIRLESLIDALIIPTNGFQIFQDEEKRALIRRLAQKVGIIIMTDSDRAGQIIRNHLRSIAQGGNIWNAYIPEILGKEKRKSTPSKEGTLGVEGMSNEIIKKALLKAGVTSIQSYTAPSDPITKTDLVLDGLSGGSGSVLKRKKMLKHLQLPSTLSANALLELLNTTHTREAYQQLIKSIYEEDE